MTTTPTTTTTTATMIIVIIITFSTRLDVHARHERVTSGQVAEVARELGRERRGAPGPLHDPTEVAVPTAKERTTVTWRSSSTMTIATKTTKWRSGS